MSDVFALDEAGARSLADEAAANPVLPGEVSNGMWHGSLESLGEGAMRGFTDIARLGELAGGAAAGFAEPFLGYRQGELTDQYYSLVDPTIKNAVDYWTPGPNEVGSAARVLGGLSEGLTMLAAGGGNPTLMIGGSVATGAMSLADQGVNPDVAAAGGVLEGAANAVGFKMPFLGRSLLTRMASGAAGNVAIGRAATLAQQQLLEHTGNEKLAEGYNPWEMSGATLDALMGLAYGGIAHVGSPVRPVERDAALALLNAKHFQEDSAPGQPADLASSVAHQAAIEQAIHQILNGDPVTPPAAVMGAGFVRTPPADRLGPLDSSTTRAAQREQFDHVIQVLDGPLARDLGGDLQTLSAGYLKPIEGMELAKDLTPAQQAIESRLARWIKADPERAMAAYDRLPDSEGGKRLNTDTARELDPSYLADRTQSQAVHEPASALLKAIYIRKLALPPRPGEEANVLFTAGGTGAGKTTGIDKLLPHLKAKAQIVYDANLDSLKSAAAKIDQALAAGKTADYVYTWREPIDALVNGAIPRAHHQELKHGTGRTVPLEDHLRTHVGSNQALYEIIAHYKGDKRVQIHVIDNSRGPGKARLVSADDIPHLSKEDYNSLRERANEATQAAYRGGTLSPRSYTGFTGQVPPQLERVGQGDRGQPQQPHSSEARGPPAQEVASAPAPPRTLPPPTPPASSFVTEAPPLPVPVPPQEQGAPEGARVVLTPTGRRIEVAPRIVEASSLVTSDNAAFPKELQPRQRGSRKSLDAQVTEIATKLEPSLLGDSATSDTGAPITGPGNVVESGNGRIMALREVYAGKYPNSPEKVSEYRNYLQSQGYNLEGFKEPVLVRERTQVLTPEQRQAFTTESNKSTAAELSPVELAQADARLLDTETLSQLRGEDLTTEKNGAFRRSFLNKIPVGERNAMLDARGNLSQEGERRLRAAILAKAYGGSAESNVTLGRILESTSEDIKSAVGALQDAAPAFARLRQMIDEGALGRDYDIAPAVLQAVEDVVSLKRSGTSLAEHLATQDMFSPTSLVIKAFYDPAGKRLASRERVAGELEKYARQAMHERIDQSQLFSEQPLSPTDILKSAPKPQTSDMFGLRTPQGGEAKADPNIDTARHLAEADPKMRVTTGEIGPDGRLVSSSVADLLARADAEVQNAQNDAKAFEAAVNCVIQTGEAA